MFSQSRMGFADVLNAAHDTLRDALARALSFPTTAGHPLCELASQRGEFALQCLGTPEIIVADDGFEIGAELGDALPIFATSLLVERRLWPGRR